MNIATASFLGLTEYAGRYMAGEGKHNFFDLSAAMTRGVFENVKRHMLVFDAPYNPEAAE